MASSCAYGGRTASLADLRSGPHLWRARSAFSRLRRSPTKAKYKEFLFHSTEEALQKQANRFIKTGKEKIHPFHTTSGKLRRTHSVPLAYGGHIVPSAPTASPTKAKYETVAFRSTGEAQKSPTSGKLPGLGLFCYRKDAFPFILLFPICQSDAQHPSTKALSQSGYTVPFRTYGGHTVPFRAYGVPYGSKL